jgi:hypothetical protein
MLVRGCLATVLALATIACCSGKGKRSPSDDPTSKHALANRPFSVKNLGEPVRSARAWITALAPNPRGGWNYLTQTYEYPSKNPTDLVVLDLTTGKQTTIEGPPGIYANSNYQMGELRAANGRVFWPALENHVIYYDPATERLKVLPKIIDGDDKAIYRMVFGPDGKLYGGTQSNGTSLPAVFSLDPDTLAVTMLGRVGTQRQTYSYAYYLAADPPWLYVAVGELPWELVAVNIKTKEHRILATRADEGFVEFDHRPEGIAVKLLSGLRTQREKSEVMWCVDGKLVPNPPAKPRNVKPPHNPITGAPDLDLAEANPGRDGSGRVRWRESGGAWRDASFRVKHTEPVEIDSLVAAPDGTLLGSAKQYHGFFRYDPKAGSTTRLAAIGISGGPRASVGNTVYIAGYPNGVLYAYDVTKPWSVPANPRSLGNFAEAAAHYAYFLIPSENGRLYYAGRRERDGVGGGIGYFDPASESFAGHHDKLESLDPSGLAVLGDRLIYAGRSTGPAAGDAQLVIYDLQLKELERLVVRPGLASTGAIFSTKDKRIVVGVIPESNALYQYNLADRRLWSWRDTSGPIGPFARRQADGSIWYTVGNELVRLDATTFEERRIGTLPETPTGADHLSWLGDRLYWASGSQLREITAPLSE